MGLFRSLTGMVTVEIRTASVSDLLNVITNAGIPMYNLHQINELSVSGCIHRTDYRKLSNTLEKRHEQMIIREKTGIYWGLVGLCKRPILLAGICLLLTLSIILPTRVLFIDVEGNRHIPKEQILEEAEKAGITFGTSRRQIRSEESKNALLLSIPGLQWLGINTYGCTAVISVKEKTVTNDSYKPSNTSSVVARCDGVVKSMIVTKGDPLCAVGQAVQENQVLVSGYTDCGTYIKATGAEAEIIARTYHQIDAITPQNYRKRYDIQDRNVRYSIKIGKKLIKLYKDSGISDISCAKIYTENQLKLPGGFILPVTIIKEDVQSAMHEVCSTEEWAPGWMEKQAEKYLLDQLVAGEILNMRTLHSTNDDLYASYAYICHESIGISRDEEIEIDGKRD